MKEGFRSQIENLKSPRNKNVGVLVGFDIECLNPTPNFKSLTVHKSSDYWLTPTDKRGLAPLGWHIPSDEEWTLLTKEIGYKVGREYNKAEKKLKSTSGWEEGLNGNNKSGFNALPAGHIVGDEFYGYGWYAGWWSSTRNNINSAFGRQFIRADGFWREPFSHYTGLSIRCVKNQSLFRYYSVT